MLEIIEQLQYVISMAAGGSIVIGGLLLKDKLAEKRNHKRVVRITAERIAQFERNQNA